MMPRPVVALLTDFGTSDRYVAAMKGVVLGFAPDAQLVDVAHDIRAGDIVEAGWLLASAWRDLPPGTVFVAVVDPGVGSERRPIGMQAHGRLAVGPDNGLLELAARGAGDGDVVELTVRAMWRHPVSPVFHGRDVFAPVAARLATGTSLREVGDPIDAIVPYPIAVPRSRPDGAIAGHIVHVDRFGNVVTNVPRELLPRAGFRVGVGQVVIERVVAYYAEAAPGELVALVGSAGYLELAMRSASARDALEVSPGATVEIWPR